jgi:DNA primase
MDLDSMGGHKRTKKERERDLADIAEMYLKGKYQQEMADWLNAHRPYQLSQRQISSDIKTIHNRWIKSQANFDTNKSAELAKIDRLEREYWDAWERSLEEFKSRTAKSKGASTDGKENIEKTLRTEDRNGDPRFLQGIERCIAQRTKILGIEAPEKREHSGTLQHEIKEIVVVRDAAVSGKD